MLQSKTGTRMHIERCTKLEKMFHSATIEWDPIKSNQAKYELQNIRSLTNVAANVEDPTMHPSIKISEIGGSSHCSVGMREDLVVADIHQPNIPCCCFPNSNR